MGIMMRYPVHSLCKLSAIVVLVLCTLFIVSNGVAESRGLQWKGFDENSKTFYRTGNYRALIIGNNDYFDEEGIWAPLSTAVKDAQTVSDIVRKEYGFNDVKLLTNVSRREILLALNELSTRVKPNDSVLLYYAGHGYLDADTLRGYWVPVDAAGNDPTTYIRNSTIRDEISIISERSQHTLLISDSCFSGSLLRPGNRSGKQSKKTERYYNAMSNRKSVQIISAGGIEYVGDNYMNSGHSPFTYFLLNELKNNSEKYMTVTDLSTRLIKSVANNVDQIPEAGVLQGAGDELGEFIFVRLNKKENTMDVVIRSQLEAKPEELSLMSLKKSLSHTPLPRF